MPLRLTTPNLCCRFSDPVVYLNNSGKNIFQTQLYINIIHCFQGKNRTGLLLPLLNCRYFVPENKTTKNHIH